MPFMRNGVRVAMHGVVLMASRKIRVSFGKAQDRLSDSLGMTQKLRPRRKYHDAYSRQT